MEIHSRVPRSPVPQQDGLATCGRTVVLGLGNPILGDDGIGLAVARELRRLLDRKSIHGVDVLISTRGGFDLIELLMGYGRALIVDCLDLPDPTPGRVHRLGLEHVAGCARLVSMHEIGIGTAFRLAGQLGVPMPADVEILAIEAADTRTIGEALTPAVRAAGDLVAQQVYEDLRQRAPENEPPDSQEFHSRRTLYAPAS